MLRLAEEQFALHDPVMGFFLPAGYRGLIQCWLLRLQSIYLSVEQ